MLVGDNDNDMMSHKYLKWVVLIENNEMMSQKHLKLRDTKQVE